ncbi:hypothetical protein [Rubrolithibacter danxiaensis]|uniref:hypothetical protein n=1 Tax=Rubrolithibacter danxiaensis TaxID=3390805 RepID=UPI003BF88896
MTSSEKEFITYWSKARREWNWGKTFAVGVLYISLPVIILYDLVNFFIIGDVVYPYFSFTHFFNLLFKFIWTGIPGGFIYGLYNWNSREVRYKKLLKKERMEE